jgi:hypothetical protein
MTERIELFERGKKHKERITSLIKEEFSNQNKRFKCVSSLYSTFFATSPKFKKNLT